MGVRAVVVCVLAAAVGFAQPPNSDRVVAQLVEELGDPVFATREKATAALKALFEKDPPYGAKVTFSGEKASAGWDAPPLG